MSISAALLLVVAAFVHAGWNLLAKQMGGDSVLFVWLVALTASALYLPPVAFWWMMEAPVFTFGLWASIAASALIHAGYFLSLQTGYRHGDLSLVYPLARGIGPLLATVFAIAVFDERPSWLALAGAGLVILGVFLITGGLQGLQRAAASRAAVGCGMLAGVMIASYTVVDKCAMTHFLVAPLIYDWLCNAGRAAVMTPAVWPKRHALKAHWRRHRRIIIGVGLLSPLAYMLVLAAMQFTPVSYVAPAREMSILIGVLMGAGLLAEGQAVSRLLAATAIVAGIAALMLG